MPDSNWMQSFKDKFESAIITVLAKIFQKPRKYGWKENKILWGWVNKMGKPATRLRLSQYNTIQHRIRIPFTPLILYAPKLSPVWKITLLLMFLKSSLYSDWQCGCLNITQIFSIHMYIFRITVFFKFFVAIYIIVIKDFLSNMISSNYLFFVRRCTKLSSKFIEKISIN